MVVTLSGGDLGGQDIFWPEGEDTLVVQGCIYRKVSDTQAVFVGVAQ